MDITNTLPKNTTAKTFAAVYVSQDKNGKPRFQSFGRGRMWPMSREVALASFEAGATVLARNPDQPDKWAADTWVVLNG